MPSNNSLIRKHALTGRTFIVVPADAAEFEALAASLANQLKPAGPLETEMFGEILHALWNQRRLDRAEAALAEESSPDGALDPLQNPAALKQLAFYSQLRIRAHRAHDRARKQLRELQEIRLLRPHVAALRRDIAEMDKRSQPGPQLVHHTIPSAHENAAPWPPPPLDSAWAVAETTKELIL